MPYLFLLLILIASFLCAKSFKNVQAVATIEEKKVEQKINEKVAMEENKNKIDINEILKENTGAVYKKTLNIDEVDLDYTTEYVENSELPTGTIQVKEEGVDGKQMMVIIKTYGGNEYISEERIEGKVVQEAKNKIVEIGTGEGTNNYTRSIWIYICKTCAIGVSNVIFYLYFKPVIINNLHYYYFAIF